MESRNNDSIETAQVTNAQEKWQCPDCETINTGSVCSACGRIRPEPSTQPANNSATNNNNCSAAWKNAIAAADQRNKSMMIWSVVVAVLLSRTAGLVAILETRKADRSGSQAEEQKYLHRAKVWNNVGCVVGAIIILSQVGNVLNTVSKPVDRKDSTQATQAVQSNNSSQTIDDTYMPPLPDAASAECKELDDGTLIQSEFDSDGNLVREIYITMGPDGPVKYSDHYYDGNGHLIILSFYNYEDHDQTFYSYDFDDRLIKYESYEYGKSVLVFTYDYTNGNDAILVTCFDGSYNILGSLVHGDAGVREENWNIDDPGEILRLKLIVIASFL